MAGKQTTNEKLLNIINGKAGDEDDEAYFKQQQDKARNSLRKCVLYGCGARAKIPKVRTRSKRKMSPFQLPATIQDQPDKTKIGSAVPPGAHQDMGKMVQFNTTKSKNDPYRVFMTSSSMDPSIIPINQPPWYFGDNNKTKPPDASMISAAARYGFRGSKDILQFHTNPYEPPDNTRTQFTPKFLKEGDIINEWVPPILATKHQTINNLESPKLWPQNTEFVTGSRLKQSPTSANYRKETTVVEPLVNRPQTSASLTSLLDKTMTERSTLQDYTKMEMTRMFQSLPMLEQSKFSSTWSSKVEKSANDVLRHTLSREIHPYEPHSLVDDTDVLKYSGSTAIVVRSQSNDECKFRLRLESNFQTLPYESRWKQIEFQFRGITSRLKKEQVMQKAIEEIGSTLRVDATLQGSPTTMRRADFVASLQKMSLFSAFTYKQLILLYNAFDSKGKNAFRFIEYVLLLALLDHPEYSVLEKLNYLWNIYSTYGADLTPMNMALEILCCAASSDSDRIEIEKLFKNEFRGCCYRMSILGSPTKLAMASDFSDMMADIASSGKQLQASGSLQVSQTASTFKTDLTVPSQYNISDHFLDRIAFIDVMRRCPKILGLFESQMINRITHLYGQDWSKSIVTQSADS